MNPTQHEIEVARLKGEVAAAVIRAGRAQRELERSAGRVGAAMRANAESTNELMDVEHKLTMLREAVEGFLAVDEEHTDTDFRALQEALTASATKVQP